MADRRLLEDGVSFRLLEGGGDRLLEIGSVLGAFISSTQLFPPTVKQTFYGGEVMMLARIFLDQGDQNLSDGDVRHPRRFYEGRVLDWGLVDRSIPIPSGLPQIADATIRMADTDFKYRRLLAGRTPLGRRVELKIIRPHQSESSTRPCFTGVITSFSTGSLFVQMTIRDANWGWIDEQLGNLVNRTFFPQLGPKVDEAFLPIVAGRVESSVENPQGQIQLQRLWVETGIGERWTLSSTPIESAVIYRQLPTEQAYSVVDPSEYSQTLFEYDAYGLHLSVIFLDFHSEQPDGTQCRADVRGIVIGLPGVPRAEGVATRNPIDFFYSMMFYIMRKASVSNPDAIVDIPGNLIPLWNRFQYGALDHSASGSASGSSGTAPLLCDGAITKSTTPREFLGRFLPCFGLDLYRDSRGKLILNFTDGEDPARPVFKEGNIVVRGSFSESVASPTCNQVRYHYGKNYATDQWGSNEQYDNLADQDAMAVPELDPAGELALDSDGEPVKTEQIQTDDLELWWVRDPFTAFDMTLRYASWKAIGSYRQQWQMPAPEVFERVELAKLVGLTHKFGLTTNPAGYINREVKISNLTLDPNSMLYTVKSIVRVPQAFCCPQPRKYSALIPGDVSSFSHDARVGPFPLTSAACDWTTRWALVLREHTAYKKLVVQMTDDMGRSYGIADEAGFAELGNVIEGHDCQREPGSNLIHVATIETNGRVAYHQFDLNLGKWIRYNEPVNTIGAPVTRKTTGAYWAIADTDRLQTTNPTGIALGATSAVVGWFNGRGATDAGNIVWGHTFVGPSSDLLLGSNITPHKLELYNAGTLVFRSAEDMIAGVWEFIAVVDDGAAVRIWRGIGSTLEELTSTAGAYVSMSGFTLNRITQGDNSASFKGAVDELAVFNAALTPTEVAALFNGGAGIYGDPAVAPYNNGNLEALWPLDDVATFASDVSGNGHGLTVVNNNTAGGGFVIREVIEAGDSYDGNGADKVSICVKRPLGEVAIAYGALELVGSVEYARTLYTVKRGGVWLTSQRVGRWGVEQQAQLQRIVAGDVNRVHLFATVLPGWFVVSTADHEVQTLRNRTDDLPADPAAVATWTYTGLSGGSDLYSIGDYDRKLSSPMEITLAMRLAGEDFRATFIDSDLITAGVGAGFGSLIWVGTDSSGRAAYCVRYLDGTLHHAWLSFGDDSAAVYYDQTNQASPSGGMTREFSADMVLLNGTVWLLHAVSTGSGILVQFLDTSHLPAPQTLADFLGTLNDQPANIECI